jgi:hypothetical protein
MVITLAIRFARSKANFIIRAIRVCRAAGKLEN